MVYKENQERLLQHYLKGEDPEDPEVFLNDLNEIFEKTQKMIKAAAEEQGIDLDEIPDQEIERVDPRTYLIYNLVYEYFNRARQLINELEKEGIPEEIEEEFEDFIWYHTLLVAKTGRLVSGFDDEFFDPEVREVEIEGTLQVINKGITISKKALEKMLNELPDYFQELVDLIDILSKYERQLKSDMRKKINDRQNFE